MKILGLTGAMGSGKSTTSSIFKKMGIAVFDCDAVVHDLFENHSGVIKAVFSLCPFVIKNGKIDRKALSEALISGKLSFETLENTVYPFLIEEREKFLRQNKKESVVVIDAPTLFEAKWDKICDFILSVHAPESVLFERVMRRAFMTKEKYDLLRSRQINEEERLKKSDYVINSCFGESDVAEKLAVLLKEITADA